jgi:hypothetical protein
MFICLDKNIGTILASDVKLEGSKYIECNGAKANRNDYPELFVALNLKSDVMTLPDYRSVLSGKVYFYIIVK